MIQHFPVGKINVLAYEVQINFQSIFLWAENIQKLKWLRVFIYEKEYANLSANLRLRIILLDARKNTNEKPQIRLRIVKELRIPNQNQRKT